MKFILDKNFVKEVTTISKDKIKSSVLYEGRNLRGNKIELYDMEAWKIAPIVRFLIEWKKSKLSLFLIIGIGLLIFVFSWLIAYLLWPTPEKLTPTLPNNDINRSRVVDPVIPTKEENKENNFNLEILNELDTFRGLKNEAELETERLTYKLELKNLEKEKLSNKILDLEEENKKLTQNVLELKENNKIINKRNIDAPADAFIYYLGDIAYEKCQNPLDSEILRKCESIYYNYLEYEKKTRKNWDF